MTDPFMTLSGTNDVPDLSIRNIRVYLRMHGWTEHRHSITDPDVWDKGTEDGVYEVIAPSTSQTRDFGERILDLLRTLSIQEDRSIGDVIRDISIVEYDAQYFRTMPSDVPAGTALLSDAVDALAGAKSLLAASAASFLSPALVLPPRRPRQARQLMEKVLAGPTFEGSYVMSVLVPLPPRLTTADDGVLFDEANDPLHLATLPFERQVTRYMHQALQATQLATSEIQTTDRGIDVFMSRAEEGVSANLCEALVAIGGEAEQPFEVRFAWALDRPNVVDPQPIRFEKSSIPVLREVSRELRSRLPESDVIFRGNVVRLHRESQSGHGEVTVSGVIIDDDYERNLKVIVQLAESEYEAAIIAHRDFHDVEVAGSILRRGNRTYMTNVSRFAAMPDLKR